MLCEHCLTSIKQHQPRVVISPSWLDRKRALWTFFHADCYLAAEAAAGAALGLAPEHFEESMREAAAMVQSARGAQ